MRAWSGHLSRRVDTDRDGAPLQVTTCVAVAAPVTVPYARFSIRGAHWFLGARADSVGRRRRDCQGAHRRPCVASFTLAPDTAVGLTQHLGLTPRWLDHVPMGGASGIVCRAARRARSGAATPRSSPASPATPITPTVFAATPRPSACSRRTPSILTAPAAPMRASRFLTAYYMRTLWRHARGFRQALRRPAQQCAEESATRCSRSR